MYEPEKQTLIALLPSVVKLFKNSIVCFVQPKTLNLLLVQALSGRSGGVQQHLVELKV